MSYLDFREMPSQGRKTKIFAVLNTMIKMPLGKIVFLPAWRRYVFEPDNNCRFDTGCLRDIANFCEQETNKWRDSL